MLYDKMKQTASAGPVPPEQVREMADALEQAELQLRMLSNAVNGGMARLAVDDGLRILSASEGYYRMTGYTEAESLEPPFCGRGGNLVLPQDLPLVAEALRRLERNGQQVSVSYRIRKKDGSVAWNTAHCARIDTTGDERTIDVLFLDITDTRRTELELERLLNSIPAGVARATVADGLRVEYANSEFYRQMGYTREEFFGPGLEGQYLRVVHPQDRSLLQERLWAFTATDRPTAAREFRITTGQGEVRWIRAAISRLSSPDEPVQVVQGILSDITDERAQRREIAVNEERYRIISQQTRDTVFDWDLHRDRIQFSPVYEKMFGFLPPPDLPIRSLTEFDIIYEDDKPQVQAMIDAILSGAPYAESEYRAKCADGSYIWCRNQVTNIFDDDGRPVRAIGLLSDINAYKQTTSALQDRAMRDSLTGLFNRMAFQRQVERVLWTRPGERHAFLLLDADHFKHINDTYGHAAGDTVLQRIARLLTESFRPVDLLGRMGGDEFAVLLVDAPDADAVLKQAERLCRRIRAGRGGAAPEVPTTVSMGLALYTEDGTSFDVLYRCADAALYEAKRQGGDRCLRG